jgi:hypothetical protein
MIVALLAAGFAPHAQASSQSSTGVVAGIVLDDTGAPIAGATVTLTGDNRPANENSTGADGQFLLVNIAVGPFRVVVTARGFAAQTASAVVSAGETTTMPPIRLTLSVHSTVDVTPSIVEVAEQQLKEQEQQRVLGILPNFYVSFNPDAAPLSPRQKLELSWKAHIDPVQFGFVAMLAGVQQWRNDYSGFGDGASGYGKRYAAAYATVWTHAMVTQVLLPSLFRQDPRYFLKGTGSVGSRIGYALSRSLVRRGDNGRWQPNYSGILGSLAAGGLSNLYYPAEDRRGFRLTLENTAIGMAGGAAGHVAQEFLWSKLTSRAKPSATK